MTHEVAVVGARRTPIGTAGKAFSDVDVAGLAAPVIRALLDDTGVAPGDVGDVVLGNCMGPGGSPARVAALAAGLPDAVPGLTVDRQCGSGLAAVAVATAVVAAGQHEHLVAGGVESASTAPWRSWRPSGDAPPVRYERAPFTPQGTPDPEMGLAADLLAERHGVTRHRQDAFAARSHRLAAAARDDGMFDREIVPVAGVTRDERPRGTLTEQRLGKLPPAFRDEGTVTAGNSCGVNDGAAAVVLTTEDAAQRRARPYLRVLGTATVGVDPQLPGLGIVPAVRRVLGETGTDLADVDVVELNEAFAGQVLACCDALDLDPDRVCTQGGALGLGHPWGASGAVLLVRLFSQLTGGDAGRRGLAAIAVGGGQGVAMLVETA